MTLKLFSIKDKHNGFIPPIPFPNEEVAQRWYKEMRAENITMKYSPEDFSLWEIGMWDSDTGIIETNVVEVIRKEL